jgi:hypothetical protein
MVRKTWILRRGIAAATLAATIAGLSTASAEAAEQLLFGPVRASSEEARGDLPELIVVCRSQGGKVTESGIWNVPNIGPNGQVYYQYKAGVYCDK